MATHSSVLAWRIPGTGEPAALPSLGSHRVGHYWSDLAAAERNKAKCKLWDKMGQNVNSALGKGYMGPLWTILALFSISLKCYQNLLLFSHSVMSTSLQPHGLQHTRLPCPSLSPGVRSNSCPLNQWCHPTISFSVVLFSACLQSFPVSGYQNENLGK